MIENLGVSIIGVGLTSCGIDPSGLPSAFRYDRSILFPKGERSELDSEERQLGLVDGTNVRRWNTQLGGRDNEDVKIDICHCRIEETHHGE